MHFGCESAQAGKIMQLIKNNPYRTIGLLVGATMAQQTRQIKRLKQFLDAEQEPEDDFSFPTLGQLNRTVDSVTDAASKLSLDSDKINAAMFWFYNGSHTDEPAFDAIKMGDLEKALNIWSKLITASDVTQRNASAYGNLSTLYLSEILEERNTKEEILEQGISLKLKFLESDFIKNFKELATDETFKTTKKDLQLLFLNQVQSEVDKNGGITSRKFHEILNKQVFSAKEDFFKSFVQKPIEQIEKKIEETRKRTKSNPEKAGEYGNDLFKTTQTLLDSIIAALGKLDTKTVSASDKLANEILQCGIILFNHFHETDTEVGEIALNLSKKAKSVALGSVVKERINETTQIFERYIKEMPSREKQKVIGRDLQFVTENLEMFQGLTDTISNAKALVDFHKPKLINIKNALGSTDNLYLEISSAIASNAQGMIVTVVNQAQNDFLRNKNIHEFKNIINEAYNGITAISSLDMLPNIRAQFLKNREVITGFKNQVNTATTGSSCYIATMAYGNYDHPQVMVLRQFRDEVLTKSQFGTWFIKKYYHYSPKMVEKMKNKKVLNTLIRKGLNQFIKLIKS